MQILSLIYLHDSLPCFQLTKSAPSHIEEAHHQGSHTETDPPDQADLQPNQEPPKATAHKAVRFRNFVPTKSLKTGHFAYLRRKHGRTDVFLVPRGIGQPPTSTGWTRMAASSVCKRANTQEDSSLVLKFLFCIESDPDSNKMKLMTSTIMLISMAFVCTRRCTTNPQTPCGG